MHGWVQPYPSTGTPCECRELVYDGWGSCPVGHCDVPSPIYVPPSEIEAILARWEPNTDPASQFRWPLCADCGREIAREPMFHVWAADRVREIHLCRECGSKWPTTPS